MLKLIMSLWKWYVGFFESENSLDRVQVIQAITTDGQGQRRGTQRTSKKGTRGQAEKLVSGVIQTTGIRQADKRTDDRQETYRRMTWQEMRDNMQAWDKVRTSGTFST